MSGTVTVALTGNPNVGKSSLFNALTGLRQHTGNWAGKTVALAQGYAVCRGQRFCLVDLPGAHAWAARTAEEREAAAFLREGAADAVIVVCDAGSLERGLTLTLETLAQTPRVVVALNLVDEARRRGIRVDETALSAALGVPVIPTRARDGIGADRLLPAVLEVLARPAPQVTMDAGDPAARLPEEAERAPASAAKAPRMPEKPETPAVPPPESSESDPAARLQRLAEQAQALAERVTVREARPDRDLRADRILTSRGLYLPLTLLLLALLFWLTLTGANLPSRLLAQGAEVLEGHLRRWLGFLPPLPKALLLDGAYRVLSWVVSVMLPPMAIFFPLFELLEDVGLLPRLAFCFDRAFCRCKACGKQLLTMCMSLGCNAVGVMGCRIIDSPRERLIAILTANITPCNGRFPALAALIVMLPGLMGLAASPSETALSALGLAGVLALSAALTLGLSRLLSATLLRGTPSAFTLELPPYRRPAVGRVLVRSLLDRTLKVLGRAVCVAAPAGVVIWCMANLQAGGMTLLDRAAGALEPLGRLMGLDGMILLAFLLGFPANEIVLPLIVMGYLSMSTIGPGTAAYAPLFAAHGWTARTVVCAILFELLHWPCGTTCTVLYRELSRTEGRRRGLYWTALAILLPTAAGMALCMLVTALWRLCGG